ncbi:MAG: CoA transferase [Gammaproteobacteria bacterium]|nr:CoA transferase [Gammaproteobacteria bacterium]
MAKVLEGIRVLDLGRVLVGPITGMLLADLGAEVVKIEPPDGDQFRSYPPGFDAVNMNKRSVSIDLRSDSGREALLRLVEDADVLLENFRPGVMARLGLDVRTLHARNPRLIVCSISGFGADGPYRTRPAYDTGAMALSGFMSLLVDPARPTVVGPPIADGITGMYACYGILGALFERERTGRGRLVESSMLESLIAFTHQAFHHYFATGDVQGPTTRPRVAQAYVMKCSDDRLIGLHLSTEDKVWRGLLSAVDSPLIAADPRFRSYEGRVEHYSDLAGALSDVFAARPSAYWMERLHEQEVPFAPVYGTDEVLADPQVRHLGSIYEVAQAGAEPFRAIRRPVRYDGERGPDAAPAPRLGQHNHRVLAEAGFGAVEIAELTGAGRRLPADTR